MKRYLNDLEREFPAEHREYKKQVSIRNWNRSFSVPHIHADRWGPEDWKLWEDSKKPLPPFAQWLEERGIK